ncbi:MAG: MipA/OmpV family protein [Thermodesulfobacteriota bacterium]|nr:MipA/OmpV family protein [Thermodesulfobacteriota bacterium]
MNDGRGTEKKFSGVGPGVMTVLVCLLLLAAPAVSGAGDTRKLPLWEAGLGVASLSMPSYRGAKNREFYLAPTPYIIYRGDFLKMDRDGLRGLFYDSPRLSVELSAGGALPASSDGDTRRAGMPDLDPVGEIGPSLNYLLYDGDQTRVRMRLPVRAIFSSDLTYIDDHGWKTHPNINVKVADVWKGWHLGITLGPIFAGNRYHAYYYEVEPAYATPVRPVWRAKGGYSGTALMLSASRRFGDIWAGMFVRYDNLDGAAFIGSPLVETRHAVMAGLAISRVFWRSERTVPVDE